MCRNLQVQPVPIDRLPTDQRYSCSLHESCRFFSFWGDCNPGVCKLYHRCSATRAPTALTCVHTYRARASKSASALVFVANPLELFSLLSAYESELVSMAPKLWLEALVEGWVGDAPHSVRHWVFVVDAAVSSADSRRLAKVDSQCGGCFWSIYRHQPRFHRCSLYLACCVTVQTVERLLSARRVAVSVVRSASLAAHKPLQNGLSLEHFAAVRGASHVLLA